MNHLDEIDYLRQGIGLRGYGQRDPLIEYKHEAYNLFIGLLDNVRNTFLSTLFKIVPAIQQVVQQPAPQMIYQGAVEGGSAFDENGGMGEPMKQQPLVNHAEMGRNDLCSCGSGKKYKKCHGK